MFDNPFHDAMAAAAAAHQQQINGRACSRRISISARKLAATLWEFQEIPLSRGAAANSIKESRRLAPEQQQLSHMIPATPSAKRNASHLPRVTTPASSHVTIRSFKRSVIQCKFGERARRNLPAVSPHLQVREARPEDSSQDRNNSPCQVDEVCDLQEQIDAPSDSFSDITKAVLGDRRPGPTTSGDLLKVLNRVWVLEEKRHSSTSTITSLRADIKQARSHAEELSVEQKSHRNDIENLTTQLADQEAVSGERQHEAVKAAIQSLREELDDERNAKRKLELIHKRVAQELIDVKVSLGKTLHNLEREQKARELMEDVCDELAREMGEDKAKVEELKRQSEKVREEMEEERRMLQMAEVWREERVQMKLAEARLQLEEKNTTLDKLRGELQELLQVTKTGADEDEQKALHPNEEDDGECSSDDEEDLHSIELNKESLSASRDTTGWSRAPAIEQETESNVRNSINRGSSPSLAPVTQREVDSEIGGSINRESSPTMEIVKISEQGERVRSGFNKSQIEAMITSGKSRGKGGKWDHQPDRSRDRSGELRPAVDAREGIRRPWRSKTEINSKTTGRNLADQKDNVSGKEGPASSVYEAANNSDMHENGRLHSSGGARKNWMEDSVLSPVKQSANFTCSPTRKWNNQRCSPNLAGQSVSTRNVQGSTDISKVQKCVGPKQRSLKFD